MNSKKKILYVITKGNFGGAQRYVYDLATSLPKDQFEAVVACGEGETLKEKLREQNIRVIELTSSQRDMNFKKDLKTFFDIKKIIQTERPDVIHLNSSKIGGLGSLASRLVSLTTRDYDLRSIFTGHAWAFNEERNFIQKALILFLHWVTIMLSHQTIVVSEKVKADIARMPFVKDKIRVIYNGIPKFKLHPKAEARKTLLGAESELPEDSKKILIVSLSELTRNKGLDIALKGIALLPREIKEKILYRVAGHGEDLGKLQELTKSLELENIVGFMGFVPEAKSLLSGANIFLLPSRTEAFPYVILEAGLAGLPIISTSVGGIPEVISDMRNGILVYPKNPREIAEAISYLLTHKEKQKEFGAEIKKTIEGKFSMEKMLSETTTIYSK